MSVAKVVEISASSPTSFEDAVKNGIDKAGEPPRHQGRVGVRREGRCREREDHRVPRNVARLVRPRVERGEADVGVGPRRVRPLLGDQSMSPQDVYVARSSSDMWRLIAYSPLVSVSRLTATVLSELACRYVRQSVRGLRCEVVKGALANVCGLRVRHRTVDRDHNAGLVAFRRQCCRSRRTRPLELGELDRDFVAGRVIVVTPACNERKRGKRNREQGRDSNECGHFASFRRLVFSFVPPPASVHQDRWGPPEELSPTRTGQTPAREFQAGLRGESSRDGRVLRERARGSARPPAH